jgi:hypothetical protein
MGLLNRLKPVIVFALYRFKPAKKVFIAIPFPLEAVGIVMGLDKPVYPDFGFLEGPVQGIIALLVGGVDFPVAIVHHTLIEIFQLVVTGRNGGTHRIAQGLIPLGAGILGKNRKNQ